MGRLSSLFHCHPQRIAVVPEFMYIRRNIALVWDSEGDGFWILWAILLLFTLEGGAWNQEAHGTRLTGSNSVFYIHGLWIYNFSVPQFPHIRDFSVQYV